MITPMFVTVGTTSTTLSSLSPIGTDVDGLNIRILDSSGRTIDGMAYRWTCDASIIDDEMLDGPCWTTLGYVPVNADNIVFQPGQGLWVYGAGSNRKLQSSGLVQANDVVVTLNESGATPVGNPTPIKVKLSEILVTGEDVDGVNIRVLDESGRTIDGMAYRWTCDASIIDDEMLDGPCWTTLGYVPVNADEIEFTAGQGLWVYATGSSQGLRFPAPTL